MIRQRRLGASVVAVLAAAHIAGVVDVAQASFPVRACRDAPSAINRSWIPSLSSSGYVESLSTCGASGAYDGLVIRDKLGGPPDASNADFGWWTLTATPGTAIASLEYSRFLEAYSDAGWKPEIRSRSVTGAQTVLETCGFSGAQDRCGVGLAGGARTSSSVEATSLSIGGRCVPTATNTVCERGASIHRLRSVLYGATAWLTDLQDPVIDGAATSDLAGGWRDTASGTVTVKASDNTGIRYRRIYVDGELEAVEEPTISGGCQDGSGDAYTYLRPCADNRGLNGLHTSPLTALSTWGDGTHTLRVGVVDTDGREIRSNSLTVRLDFTAPEAPAPAAIGGPDWRSSTVGEVSWSLPNEVDRAPVTRVDVEVCASSRPCLVTVVQGGLSGTTLSHRLTDLPEGETRIRIRHTDEAGNTGAWSPTAFLRRDTVPPTPRVVAFPSGTVPAGATLTTSASFADGVSGMREQEREVQVDEGEWRAHSGSVTAEAGRSYRLRVRGVDVAGNTGAWQTSGPIVVPVPAPAPAAGPTPSAQPPARTPARADARLRLRSAVLDSSRRVLTARGTTAPGVAGTVRVRLEVRRGGRTVTCSASSGCFRPIAYAVPGTTATSHSLPSASPPTRWRSSRPWPTPASRSAPWWPSARPRSLPGCCRGSSTGRR